MLYLHKETELMKKTLITTAILLPLAANASLSDTRSAGMGGVGAASADYLAASFHNPALAATHDASDHFGLLMPSVGIRAHDGDNLYDKIDSFQEANDMFEGNPSDPQAQKAWKKALKDLDNVTVNVEANAGIVLAIPNKYVSVNFFNKAEGVTMAVADVVESDFEITDPHNHSIQSTAYGVGGATIDTGITLAKEFKFADKLPIKLGISPKYQQIYVINYMNSVDGFDKDEFKFKDLYNSSSAFNLDAGVSYNISKDVRFGLYGKNLISQSLQSKESFGTHATYLVEPEYTAGFAYSKRLYSLTVDIDLNERKYFKEHAYSTQALRVGGELNAWDWAQLRLGYIHSMTEHQDDMITAGIGLKPFGKFGFDIAGQYGKDNNFGASAQMIFQF